MSSGSVPERLKELEVNQSNFLSVFEKFTENTDKNLSALTEQSSNVSIAIAEFSSSSRHLEQSVMKELAQISKMQSNQQLSITTCFSRITDLEKIVSENKGYKKAKDETKSFYLANYMNIIKLISSLSAGIGVIYYLANHVVKV